MPDGLNTKSKPYRLYLFYLGIPPLSLLLFGKPVWIVIIYAVAGSFSMPFLAGTLLFFNNKRQWINEAKNGWVINLLLVISLVLFFYLLIVKIFEYIR